MGKRLKGYMNHLFELTLHCDFTSQLYKMCKMLKEHRKIEQFETGSTSGKFFVKVRVNDNWSSRMEADELIKLAGDELCQQIRSCFQLHILYYTVLVVHMRYRPVSNRFWPNPCFQKLTFCASNVHEMK